MARTTIAAILQGGDRRSIGKSNHVAALILSQPERFPELLECLWHEDPVIRMRAADAAEKISAENPAPLRPFKEELLGLAAETTQQEIRWHLALMLPRLSLTLAERKRAFALLKEFLDARSSIVKACALQGLAELAQGNPELGSEVAGILEQASRTGTPAMKARARKLQRLRHKST